MTTEDFEFVSSVRSAVLIKSPKSTQQILWITAGIVAFLLIWASFASVDEITRGEGKVIPSGQLQMVQNLEGGIVKEILVKKGDKVKEGQPLLLIENSKFTSDYAENIAKINQLIAKEIRLTAEAFGQPFSPKEESYTQEQQLLIENERNYYNSNMQQLASQKRVLEEQLSQKRNDRKKSEAKLESLRKSYELLRREIEIQMPLAQKGVISEVEIIKLQREANKEVEEIQSVKLSIPSIISEIEEIKSKINEAQFEFENRAKKERNEVLSEIIRLQKSQEHLSDQVSRTAVTAPVDGQVNQMFVNTLGGVIRPGMDLLEIVPSEDLLVIEAKIKPSDIAFLFPKQKAIVKFSAYDFAIYGGVEGELSLISPDTITDEEGNSFYLVQISTKKTYLEREGKRLDIIPGMTASVDILTGKKTIMDYLLKPIFKAQSHALSER
ncbi:MAG: hemolysin secretion protein D [Sulfuricurvum sp. PC08-66]|nr:MAG: hemolysin secretion protein D [Sulfuricurvum sp. PC08-66]